MNDIRLSIAALDALLARPRGERMQMSALRAVLGAATRPIGYGAGANYAFLAVHRGSAALDLKRVLVYLDREHPVVVSFDFATVLGGDPRPCWKLDGAAGGWSVTSLQPVCPKPGSTEAAYLTLLESGPRQAFEPIVTMDLVGLRLADRVVAFYTERYMARSVLYFDAGGSGTLRCLVAGLAPGTWEIWRDGFLVDPEGAVAPSAGALYFEGPPGGYFLRPLG